MTFTLSTHEEAGHWIASINDWWVSHGATKEAATKAVIKSFETETGYTLKKAGWEQLPLDNCYSL